MQLRNLGVVAMGKDVAGGLVRLSALKKILDVSPSVLRFAAIAVNAEGMTLQNTTIYTVEMAKRIVDWLDKEDPGGKMHKVGLCIGEDEKGTYYEDNGDE